MNKLKKVFLSLGFFIILMLMANKSNATTISVTPAEPKVGDEITVTVTIPNVHTSAVTANVTGVASGKIKVVGGDLSGEARDYSKSGKFTCDKEGTINIEITSDSSAVLDGKYVDVAAKKTVTVKAKATPPPTTPPSNPDDGGNNGGNGGNNGGGGTTTPPATKSSEARLSNFGMKPNDFSGFKRDKTEYSTEVPNNVKEVEVYATPVDKNAKVTGAGNVALQEGNNTVEVKVTAEDGNHSKTYKLTIKRRTVAEDEALAAASTSSDADLKTLGIKPEEYDFSGFKKDVTEYEATVPNEVGEIEIYAEASDSKAQVNGAGMVELEEGENEVQIEVIAEDGTKKTYTIKVTRDAGTADENEDSADEKFGLSSLEIAGVTLSPSFKNGTYKYTVGLREDLASLEIEAEATDKDATVEIVGNEDLKQGENTITILVKNEKTGENATYQITVNKNVPATTEKMSWFKPSTWGKEEIIKIIIVVVLIVLIISAVILKIKIAREGNEAEDLDFPGADELDKALLEHQELSEDEVADMNMNESRDFRAGSVGRNSFENDANGFDADGVNMNGANINTNTMSSSKKAEIDEFLSEDFSDNTRKKGRHF